MGHRVDRLDVAHAKAEARAGQQVGRVRHRLHPAGDADLEVAGADRLVGEPDRAHARGADLVDRLRGDLLRDPGLDLRLARGDLALAGLQHLAEDHLLDLARVDLGALQRGLDRLAAELGRVLGGERSAHLPERGARGAEDDCLGHRGLSVWGGARPRRKLVNASRRRAHGARYRLAAPCSVEVVSAAARRARRRPRRGRRSPRARSCPPSSPTRPGAGDAKAGFKKLAAAPSRAAARVLVVGLGKRDELDAERLRVAAALAAKQRRDARRDARSPGCCPTASTRPSAGAALVEGTILASYRFDRFRAARRRRPAAAAARAPDRSPAPSDATRSSAEAEVARGRRRGRQPRPRRCRTCPRTSSPRRRSPTRAEEIAAAHDALEVEVLDREAIAAAGHGRAASPSRRAAATEPRLIVLRYAGGGARPADRPGRQGGDLRQRRDLDQAVGRHARDEDGHVGRRRGARGDRRDRRARPRARPGRRRSRRPRTCPAAPRSSPATSSPSSTARRSRSTTPTPRAG